jgi:multidrug efflux system membrane fusion protein
MAHVKSGLAAGERVVVDGLDRLRDGAHVTVPAGSGQTPAAAAAPAGQAAPAAGAPAQTRQKPPAAGTPGETGEPQTRTHSQNRRNSSGQ